MISKLLVSLFYLVGEWGFVLLFFWGLFLLRFQPNYMTFFVIGLLLNTIFNMFLKAWLKEPRPSNNTDLKNLLSKHGLPFCYDYGFTSDEFGMPSGHSQNIAFILTYLHAVLGKNVPWYTDVLGLLVLINRLAFNFHTWQQILVGLFIGSLVAYGFYYISKRKIIGFLKEKKDDNYFGLL
jgi:membrane-associated phospholipid phosphatase